MPDWIEKRVSVGNIITLAALAFGLIGFYFTTTLTLEQQDKALTKHEALIEKLFEANKTFFVEIQRVQQGEQASRDNVRSEMIARSDRATENQIATIQRLVAVETEIRGLRTDLSRILDRIERARPN